MLGGAHIKSLINANLADPANVTTLTRVVNEIQANLTRRFTRERVLRNMLDAHFIINDNKKNRLASELISIMNKEPLSRNSIKTFLSKPNRNIVLSANGKYRVTEKSQGQRLGELNRYVFNSGNVRNAFLKNLNSSGTKLTNANRYLSQSSKYNVKNLNAGKRFVKFKNVPAPAPTISRANAMRNIKKAIEQTATITTRHVTSIQSAREMKKLRANVAKLQRLKNLGQGDMAAGQAALAAIQRNLAAAQLNAEESKKKAAALQANRNSTHAEKEAALRTAAAEAAGLRHMLVIAVSHGAATKAELNAAQAAFNAARANANRKRQENAATVAATTAAATAVQNQLNAALRNKTASNTQILQLRKNLKSTSANASAAQNRHNAALQEALAAAQTEKMQIEAMHKAALKTRNTELVALLSAEKQKATQVQKKLLNEATERHAKEIANVRKNLANHQASLATVRAGLIAAERSLEAASGAERNKAARELAAAQAAHTAALAVAEANKRAALAAQNTAHQNVLSAEIAAKNAAIAARNANASQRNAALREAEAARAALGKARALEAAAVNAAGKAVNAAKAGAGAVLGLGLGVVGLGLGTAKSAVGAFRRIPGFGGGTPRGLNLRANYEARIKAITRNPRNQETGYETLKTTISQNTKLTQQNKNKLLSNINGLLASFREAQGQTTSGPKPSLKTLQSLTTELNSIRNRTNRNNAYKKARYEALLREITGSSNRNKAIKIGAIEGYLKPLLRLHPSVNIM